jgi:hypothetical protein
MQSHVFRSSSAIASARYNPETGQLDVTFHSGRTYTHEGVPEDEVEAFFAADSAGRFYQQNIKGSY